MFNKRFLAEVAEPRPGVRSGNIKGSKNIPFKKCLNDDNTFKSN
jgi:thiosulfate/3-mercaptopyruvate sulfurtransferase